MDGREEVRSLFWCVAFIVVLVYEKLFSSLDVLRTFVRVQIFVLHNLDKKDGGGKISFRRVNMRQSNEEENKSEREQS